MRATFGALDWPSPMLIDCRKPNLEYLDPESLNVEHRCFQITCCFLTLVKVLRCATVHCRQRISFTIIMLEKANAKCNVMKQCWIMLNTNSWWHVPFYIKPHCRKWYTQIPWGHQRWIALASTETQGANFSGAMPKHEQINIYTVYRSIMIYHIIM
jgi:hypothetical protein